MRYVIALKTNLYKVKSVSFKVIFSFYIPFKLFVHVNVHGLLKDLGGMKKEKQVC